VKPHWLAVLTISSTWPCQRDSDTSSPLSSFAEKS
jgi:hypothetical protein